MAKHPKTSNLPIVAIWRAFPEVVGTQKGAEA